MPEIGRWTVVGAIALVLSVPTVVPAAVREYFIAAEDVTWDFAPPGSALAMGGKHPDGVPRPWAGHTRTRRATRRPLHLHVDG